MKIGFIADRINRPRTGIGNYAYNLIKEFSKMDDIKSQLYLINYEEGIFFKDLKKIILKTPLDVTKKSFYFWHLYLQIKLKRDNLGLDIIHSPENATPFVKLRSKKVITVHDIIPYLFPETYSIITQLRYKLFFKRTLKTADKIIANSERTKKDLINYFDVPSEKIRVTLLAADEIFKPLSHTEVTEVKRRYELEFPFILYVGNLEKRKNIETLIKSYYQIKQRGINHKIVIVGKKGWKSDNILAEISHLKLQDDIVFTGYVSDEDLPALYNAASLFVYPSIYEGFGLPPLEAMSCGCPVITSNTSSLPEVVGDGGIMFDPHDIDELANLMYEVLTNNELKDDLIEKGLRRAKMFSWNKCAKETLEVYREVAL